MWALKSSTLIGTSQITARSPDYHMQYFSLLTLTLNYQSMKFLLVLCLRFPSLESSTGIRNSPCLLTHLINTREKKIKSWTHPISSILEWNQEQKDAVSADLKEDFLFHPTTPHLLTIKTLKKTKLKNKIFYLFYYH